MKNIKTFFKDKLNIILLLLTVYTLLVIVSVITKETVINHPDYFTKSIDINQDNAIEIIIDEQGGLEYALQLLDTTDKDMVISWTENHPTHYIYCNVSRTDGVIDKTNELKKK